MQQKIIFIGLVILIVLFGTVGLGVFYFGRGKKIKVASNAVKINFPCEQGKTVYEVLKKGRLVQLRKNEQGGDEVYSIFGLKPNEAQQWVWYLNGRKANIASWQYQCQDKEKITWTIEIVNYETPFLVKTEVY